MDNFIDIPPVKITLRKDHITSSGTIIKAGTIGQILNQDADTGISFIAFKGCPRVFRIDDNWNFINPGEEQ